MMWPFDARKSTIVPTPTFSSFAIFTNLSAIGELKYL